VSLREHLVSLWDKVISAGAKVGSVQRFGKRAGAGGATALPLQDDVASEVEGEFPACDGAGGPGSGGRYHRPTGGTGVGAGEAHATLTPVADSSRIERMSPMRTLGVYGCRRR